MSITNISLHYGVCFKCPTTNAIRLRLEQIYDIYRHGIVVDYDVYHDI